MSIFNTSRNVLLAAVALTGTIGWCLSGCSQKDAQQTDGQEEPDASAPQPSHNGPTAKAKLQVTEAAVGKDDKALIARQKVCPVSGEKLGGMGDPIKLLVDGHPVYLCCPGCVAKVKHDPETYLRKALELQKK